MHPWSSVAASILAGGLLAATMPAAANHVQMDSGKVIVFDHAGGNEWWVEARLAGQDGGRVASLWVAQYPASSSMWREMIWHPDWGKWTASYHVAPGNPVKFRAIWSGGAMQDSCWFSHPGGVETCGGAGHPKPFEAQFTMVKGNEWWVQSQVTPNDGHTLDHVEVQISGGGWRPLQLQPWGVRAYAGSYHIPDGSLVRLRAWDTGMAASLSGCYTWIPPAGTDAAATSCGANPPPPGIFTATFSQVRGNAWWAELVLQSSSPATRVTLTIDCAATRAPSDMTYHADWGKWALGTEIPSGSKVTFTAYGSNGSASSQGYVWPQASPTSGC